MKKYKLLSIILLTMLYLTGCSISNVALDIGKHVKNQVESNGVQVKTESEMRAFALKSLKKKYKVEFEFNEDTIEYSHYANNKIAPMQLQAKAFPKNNKEDEFIVEVTEPNIVKDNYFFNSYKSSIVDKIQKDLGDLEAKVTIDYPISSIVPTEIDENIIVTRYEVDTEYCSNTNDYIPLVRSWMDYLYSLDNDNWYLEISSNGNVIWTLNPKDNNFDSTNDWSDELIYKYIERKL